MRTVVLPDDDSFLSGMNVQWWFWAGHLYDGDDKRYGFEIVFFAFNSWKFFKNQIAQAAITDVDRQSHSYREEIAFCKLPPKLMGKFDLMAVKDGRAVVAAYGGDGRDSLYCEIDEYVLDVSLEATEEPFIYYDGQSHSYSFGGDTYHYDRNKLKTAGTLTIAGKRYTVTGVSWFNRQYGNVYPAIFNGWQWFAIDLFDGRTIMLYDYQGAACVKERFGSITAAQKRVLLLSQEFVVTALAMWQCPRTRIHFPSGWKVKLPGEELLIEPVVKDQALRAKHIFWVGPEYWEGACSVADSNGNQLGQAYVELNGFGHKLISIMAGGLGDFGI